MLEKVTKVDVEPVAWKNVLPGGRITDKFESARVGDYNQGWNDYRKAAHAALSKHHQQVPTAYLYTLEYGAVIVDRKVSEHQLNYPFGVAGADYLIRNDDGVSYVRQTPLYSAPPASALAALRAENERLSERVARVTKDFEYMTKVMNERNYQLEQAQATIAIQQGDAQEWARVNAMTQADAARMREVTQALCDRIYDEGCTPLDWREYEAARAALEGK